MKISRLPLIRHVRYYYLAFQYWRWWDRFGRFFGAVPNEADMMYLHKVWKGEA